VIAGALALFLAWHLLIFIAGQVAYLFQARGLTVKTFGLTKASMLVGGELNLNFKYKPQKTVSMDKDDEYVVYSVAVARNNGPSRKLASWSPLPRFTFSPRAAGDYVLTVEAWIWQRYQPGAGVFPAPIDEPDRREVELIQFSVTDLPFETTSVATVSLLAQNAIVFLYGVAPQADFTGKAARVAFRPSTRDDDIRHEQTWQYTPLFMLSAEEVVYQLVAGCYATTQYEFRHEVFDSLDADVATAPRVYAPFTPLFASTTRLPKKLFAPEFLTVSAITGPARPAAPEGTVLFLADGAGISSGAEMATDLAGDTIWYSSHSLPNGAPSSYSVNTFPGGLIVSHAGCMEDECNLNPQLSGHHGGQLLLVADLGGGIVAQASTHSVSQEIGALFGKPNVTIFSHDAVYVEENGHYLILGMSEHRRPGYDTALHPSGKMSKWRQWRNMISLVNGSPPEDQASPADLADTSNSQWDIVVELDSNLSVVGYWDTYDHVSVDDMIFQSLSDGQMPFTAEGPTYDEWQSLSMTHVNTLHYTPATRTLIVNVRNQDDVYAVPYDPANGGFSTPVAEDAGAPKWTLRKNFTLFKCDSMPLHADGWAQFDTAVATSPEYDQGWFSHEHMAQTYPVVGYDHLLYLTAFDNGTQRRTVNAQCYQTDSTKNGRCAGDLTVNSRGKAYVLNTATFEAFEVLSQDLHGYASVVGTSQLLSNGNLWFHSGSLRDDKDYRMKHAWSESYEIAAETGEIFSGLQLHGDSVVYRTLRLADIYSNVRDGRVAQLPAGLPAGATRLI
jgi:hypothetical protein